MIEFDLLQADFVNVVDQLRQRLAQTLAVEPLDARDAILCREQLELIAGILQDLPDPTYLHLLRRNAA